MDDQNKSGVTADPASEPDGGKGLGAEICSEFATARYVAGNSGKIFMEVELASWAGIPLMLHQHLSEPTMSMCSHEPSGIGIAMGKTLEDALCNAVAKMRRNWEQLPALLAATETLNAKRSEPA